MHIESQPIKGQANKQLIKYLSKILKIAPTKIQLTKGQTSKNKVIEIDSSDLQYENLTKILMEFKE